MILRGFGVSKLNLTAGNELRPEMNIAGHAISNLITDGCSLRELCPNLARCKKEPKSGNAKWKPYRPYELKPV